MSDAATTPEYDALVEKLADMKARRGDRPLHPAEAALRTVHSRAITSGQRAGERAAHNVYRPYEFVFSGLDPEFQRELGRRSNDAAKLASARARERYVTKALKGAS
jgi:hypothetical protein